MEDSFQMMWHFLRFFKFLFNKVPTRKNISIQKLAHFESFNITLSHKKRTAELKQSMAFKKKRDQKPVVADANYLN
jgi:hypothetical protein